MSLKRYSLSLEALYFFFFPKRVIILFLLSHTAFSGIYNHPFITYREENNVVAKRSFVTGKGFFDVRILLCVVISRHVRERTHRICTQN